MIPRKYKVSLRKKVVVRIRFAFGFFVENLYKEFRSFTLLASGNIYSMRSLYLLICLALTVLTSAQEQKVINLKQLISSAQNDFKDFRDTLGVASSHPQEIFYQSTVVLEGSKDNSITLIPDILVMYHTCVGDSLSRKEAERLAKAWREKVLEVTTNYKEEVKDYREANTYSKSYNYNFKKVVNKVLYTIKVSYAKRNIDNYYSVTLSLFRQWKGNPENE